MVLIGFMGAGKSSVGQALGSQLGWPFEDLDQRIERREGRKVHEIFRDWGESGFRRSEHAALRELLSELGAAAEKVIALGGGAFVQRRNASLLRDASVVTVFLDAEAEQLWRRCRRQANEEGLDRPLLGSLARFRELYQTRRPHYLKASLRHDTGRKTVNEIADELVKALGLQQFVIGRETEMRRPRMRGEK